jgi:hypothetical protein
MKHFVLRRQNFYSQVFFVLRPRLQTVIYSVSKQAELYFFASKLENANAAQVIMQLRSTKTSKSLNSLRQSVVNFLMIYLKIAVECHLTLRQLQATKSRAKC